MRRHWIDNLRWVTVLLVLLYHVVYFYNNKGVFGGVGGFGDGPQYQDVLMYVLYPWFMPLLFLLAGVSARYALGARSGGGTAGQWFKSRTRKLLVPSTIGLFVFQWMTGFFNTHVAGNDVLSSMPGVAKYMLWAVSGTGPLWFIQDLWLFSLLLLVIHKVTVRLCGAEKRDEVRTVALPWMVTGLLALGVLFWLGQQVLVFNPRPDTADGLWNLYKPVFYFIVFLMGYFVFWRDRVQEALGRVWLPLMAAAVAAGATLTITTFGQDNTSPRYLASPLNCLYGWLMCLAMMGWFKACFDRTGRFAAYMTRSSFGLYIVHYLVVAGLGYMLKFYTQLPPAAIYVILTVAVFTLSPLLYELLCRVPVVRWCVLGEGGRSKHDGMESARLLLRPWREEDAEALYRYASDPEVGPRAGWLPHKSVDESREIIRTLFAGEGMWAVVWKASGEPIGCVGYLPATASNMKIAVDEGEVGYWIGRPFWSQGVATEALRMVVEHCFREKGFSTLWGSYFPDNPASGRVMEKCGFVDTGRESLCPNLAVGGDRPVKVMKLECNHKR